MTLYCDESGGLSAGAMTFAAVALDPAAADAIIARFRTITGLRGELKGSRITTTERGLVFEIMAQHRVRGWIAVADGARIAAGKLARETDIHLYSQLLNTAVAAFLPASSGACVDVTIDEGRYDSAILAKVRRDVQESLGQWGQATLAASHRSSGIQIADVIANSLFNMTIGSARSVRIEAILKPWIGSGRLVIIPLQQQRD